MNAQVGAHESGHSREAAMSMSNVMLIKDFFAMNGKQAMAEVSGLTSAEREELAALIREAQAK